MDQKTIDALTGEKGFHGAIEALTQANRTQPDPRLEQQLAQLRLKGFQETSSKAGPRTWPPAYENPFAATSGIPEIESSDLNLNTLSGGILNHGSLIVRNLLSSKQATSLTQDINRAAGAQDTYLKNPATKKTTPWFSPPEQTNGALKLNRKFISETGGVCTVDSPRAMFRVFECYYQLGLKNLLTEYFGEAPCIAGTKWVLRRVPPVEKEVDWHQDGSFMGTDVRSVNVWIALSHCGGEHDNAGLELLPKRFDHIVSTGSDGATMQWSLSPTFVNREFVDTPPANPAFSPGDAILFDHFNVHRTAYSPTMRDHRYAIECWFFAASRYWGNQISLLF